MNIFPAHTTRLGPFYVPHRPQSRQTVQTSPAVFTKALQSSVIYATVSEGEELWVTAPVPGERTERQTNGKYDPRPITVTNARQRATSFDLHTHGFTLADFKAPEGLDLDWTNKDEVTAWSSGLPLT